ncbi:MAG: peptide chain release factor-like protein [Chloroflexota bacterium]|nr:peptide chain release factor-like protein [Chloroflexota bacterium]
MPEKMALLNTRGQPPYSTDREALTREVQIEVWPGRGPGGVRKEKMETAVRITHMPTGITITASKERTQLENRKLAMERLQKRLERLNRQERTRLRALVPSEAIKEKEKSKRQESEKKMLRRSPLEEEAL